MATVVDDNCTKCGKNWSHHTGTYCQHCGEKKFPMLKCEYCGRQFPSAVAVRVHETKCLVPSTTFDRVLTKAEIRAIQEMPPMIEEKGAPNGISSSD